MDFVFNIKIIHTKAEAASAELWYWSYYFSQFHSKFLQIQKCFQVVIVLKLNTRNMSSVTMLKHINLPKKGLLLIYKMCLYRPNLRLQAVTREIGIDYRVYLWK